MAEQLMLARTTGTGARQGHQAIAALMVILMVAASLAPMAAALGGSRNPDAPDLRILESNVVVQPTPLVQGQQARVGIVLENVGMQKAYAAEVLLQADGVTVDSSPIPFLDINGTAYLSLNWTPVNAGDIVLKVVSWYGAASAKLDENWDNNNVTRVVRVLSRPDAQVTSTDILVLLNNLPNPEYIRDGDTLTVRVTVRNLGTANITSCNVTLWETQGMGGPKLVARQSGVLINGSSAKQLTFDWNTTNWAGKRMLVANVTDVVPRETNFANNRASKAVKIHTKEDLVFDLGDKETVTSVYKVNFFIQIEDNAVLTIEKDGNMSILEEFDDQFDIVLLGRGSLVIDGGIMASNHNCTIFLYDQSSLVVKGGGSTNLRIVSEGTATVVLEDSNVTTVSIEMSGGSLSIRDSTVRADRLVLTGTALDMSGSDVELREQLVINARTTTIRDTHILVRRVFGDFTEAVTVYPTLDYYDPDTYRADGLPPALVATNGATVDLINVSVDSTVYTTGDKIEYWTEDRVAATGTLSVIYIHRYLTVKVVEWSGKVVPGAHVQVLDYFKDDVKAEGYVDDEGVVRLEVVTDYIKETLSPFVGNFRVHAELDTRLSDYVRISHFKYPQMATMYNDYTLTMVLPPSGAPDPDPRTLNIRVDQTLSGNIDRNIIIDNAVVTVKDATLFLEQDYGFQWFVLVKGTRGALVIDGSTFSSTYTFVCFLEDNARLTITGASEALNVRVVAFEQSTVTIVGSEFSGDLYATCQEVAFSASTLNLIDTHIDATKVTLNAAITVEQGLTVKAHSIEIKGADVTNAYALSRSVGVSTLRSLVSIYGWAKLDDPAVTGNLSWFKEYSRGVNISIEADLLNIEDSFIYADELSIVVERNPNANQTKVTGSWVGAQFLWFAADDLRAERTSFNRPLDDLDLRDRAWLFSVEVPSVACRDNSTAERYWYLTVHAVDGAGSDRSGALLEVVSTETNRSIGTGVRTDPLGHATMAILANTTDRTGDYFVGSIMFRLKYDQKQYAAVPAYTPWVRVAMKADLFREMAFAETIESPKKDLTYLVFDRIDLGPIQDLRYFTSTFERKGSGIVADDMALAWAFYNITHPETLWTDRMRSWDVVKGESATFGLLAVELINNVWEPLDSGIVRFYIVNSTVVGPDFGRYTPDPEDAHVNYDRRVLRTEVWPGESGYCETVLEFPDSTGSYWLFIEVEGGAYDPIPQPMNNYTWAMQVVDPRNIEVIASVTPKVVEVGNTIRVSGTVRYASDATGVNGSEITIFGQRITQQRLVSGLDGSFSVVLQAPLIPADSYTLTVLAVDTLTENNGTIVLDYTVIVVTPDVEPDETNWLALYVVIIIIVLAAAIGGGAMIFLRRQWGKLVECGECGAFIPANTPKCPKCGVEFETDLARCSECEAWIPADSPSCPVCGTPFTIEVLEKQAVVEEAAEQGKPIDMVTTSQAKIPPIPLATATAGPDVDEDATRRTRIKKRVKKRLTVTEADATIDTGAAGEEAGDLYAGAQGAQQGAQATRLPGIDMGEEQLSEDELSKLLPTEDMLKELMLTTDKAGGEAAAGAEAGAKEDAGEKELLEEIPSTGQQQPAAEAPKPPELEEIPTPRPARPEPMAPALQRLQLSGPVGEVEEPDMGGMGEPGEEMVEDEGMLLKELGLKPEGAPKRPKGKPPAPKGKPALRAKEEEAEATTEGDEGLLGDILNEPKEREAPKLCPNCGGNWILYKGGEYTCRICGEKW